MGSAGKKLRTRMDIGKDIQSCLDDLNNMTHAKLAELLNLSEKTVDRMVAGKGPITKTEEMKRKFRGGLIMKKKKWNRVLAVAGRVRKRRGYVCSF